MNENNLTAPPPNHTIRKGPESKPAVPSLYHATACKSRTGKVVHSAVPVVDPPSTLDGYRALCGAKAHTGDGLHRYGTKGFLPTTKTVNCVACKIRLALKS